MYFGNGSDLLDIPVTQVLKVRHYLGDECVISFQRAILTEQWHLPFAL